MKHIRLMLLLPAMLAGCATNETAVFVTKTSVSVLDADSTPAGISIAYNRDEGYYGPRYDSGAVPPVLASIRSDAKVFNPEVQQLYATGNAAEIASGIDPDNVTVDATHMTGNKKVMFFGTATTTGLKVDLSPAGIPKGLLFGFRRKEATVIPMAKDAKSKDGTKVEAYPSVIATINTQGSAKKAEGTDKDADPMVRLVNRQYFATGVAAEEMAVKLRDEFLERAREDLGVDSDAQRIAAGDVMRCYVGVPPAQRPEIWEDAFREKLLTKQDREELEEAYNSYKDPTEENAKGLARVDRFYAGLLLTPDLKDSAEITKDGGEIMKDSNKITRLHRLKAHEKLVCYLSRKNAK